MTAYIADRRRAGIQPGTINREIGLLSSALNWARAFLNWDVPNPAAGRRLKEPPGRVRWLTRAEAAALLQAARQERRAPHLADFIRLDLHTGMRAGEMLVLEWVRVDLSARLIYLAGDHQKNRRVGSVPLNQGAREALLARAEWRAKHCPESPWVFYDKAGHRIASVKKGFRSACARAHIKDFTPHDLRHTCAAWLVQAGVPLPRIRDLLRHSTIRVTERYAHLAPTDVADAVATLDPPADPSRSRESR